MSGNCYIVARNCVSAAKNKLPFLWNGIRMKPFPITAPLELLAIGILGRLLITEWESRVVLVMTDQIFKLVDIVPFSSKSEGKTAKAVVDIYISAYHPRRQLSSEYRLQFTSMFFQHVRRILDVENPFKITYHPQCYERVEQFNRTIIEAAFH